MKKLFPVVFVLIWACGGTPEATDMQAEPEEPEPIAVTRWTEKSELFMEYPPLRAGETSRFAIHLTDLRTFKPLTEGRAVVELAYGAGQTETFSEDGPSRPGIFRRQRHTDSDGLARHDDPRGGRRPLTMSTALGRSRSRERSTPKIMSTRTTPATAKRSPS